MSAETVSLPPAPGPVSAYCDMQLLTYVFVCPPPMTATVTLRVLCLRNADTGKVARVFVPSTAAGYRYAVDIPVNSRIQFWLEETSGGRTSAGPVSVLLGLYRAPPRPGPLTVILAETIK